ncbi:ALG6 [Branchiostoma lanceolatum]|uniref:Alpha-1,3-glucosyltransferase n=1 Tax=Branchiostoma lanceolatum TaxID=7740 RepID=A0A8K0E8E3_BRALA|nr:ALG6 [Branchiostoma lanceolatum]
MDTRFGTLYTAVVFAVFVRWAVSLNSYSGMGKPPMFGDYEAQRHWMEITTSLPLKQWYFNSTDNDLLYWGLDYPPLTAYHMWLCGKVAAWLNPDWTALFTSRGYESYEHKLFMRYSVLIGDALIYIPAVLLYCFLQKKFSHTQKVLLSCVLLLFPGLIIIDYGHFQYNSISLGLTLWAVIALSHGHEMLGSAAFMLALCYKQMSLYHAMPFFCYLLGKCWQQRWTKGFFTLCCIGVSVLATFAFVWLPFLTEKDLFLQVVHRIFPVARGVFEDKVSNFWCSLSVVVKFRNFLSHEGLLSLCLATTLLGLVPSSLDLLFRPSVNKFKLALVNSSLVFFLFSFQVHEKSILLPALPVCLLLPWRPFTSTWFLTIATFSMLPLLVKDGLVMATLITSILFIIAVELGLQGVSLDPTVGCPVCLWSSKNLPWLPHRMFFYAVKSGFYASLMGALFLGLLSIAVPPPSSLPDLWPVLISVYSCLHFLGFTLYYHIVQLMAPGTKETTVQKAKKTQ